ncbi:SLAP domain-containing protein [Lactobacillus apis]|uniref:SLAP domain-containing protein n=1 Tax=Lactobacillus apis TaxID=303541 RepID=UPI0027415AC0|nr:SLAP domain-containing protein [Lactobacillus apis]WLS84850.1 SLAP domain-containing protein [Lactobacillus apis]
MKVIKKVILVAVMSSLTLATLISLPSFTTNTVEATVTNNRLKLAHGAYIYNKYGQRLTTYRGSSAKTRLSKGTTVSFVGSVEPIERDSKRFFLMDSDNYNQSWLPYKEIKGSCYYNIGAGGYIKAVNVSQIAGKSLYTSEATVKVKNYGNMKPYSIGTGKDKTIVKSNKVFKVDRITALTDDPELTVNYRISGTTDAFLSVRAVKEKVRQKLKIYTAYTHVKFLQPAKTYNIQGTLRTISRDHSTFLKDDIYPVENLIYLWVPSENKAELFYLLKYSWEPFNASSFANYLSPSYGDGLVYVKASDTMYFTGPYLKPRNTPEQAKDMSKVATSIDKQKLQKLIDQEKITNEYANKSPYRLCVYHYKYILRLAKDTINSAVASSTEINEVSDLLSAAQTAVINSTDETDDRDSMLNRTLPYIHEFPTYYIKNRN